MGKKTIMIFLCSLMLVFGLIQTAGAEEENIQLIINNELYSFSDTAVEAGPCIVDDRVYVPLRVVSQGLGCAIQWNELQQQVLIDTVAMEVPENPSGVLQIIINGHPLAMDETTGWPFITESGSTMVPLRVLGEALDCDVRWENYVVIISEKPQATAVTASYSVPDNNHSGSYLELTIMGESLATREQIKAFLEEKEPIIRQMMEQSYPHLTYQPIDESMIDLYLSIGAKYNIRGDLALAQALKETGYLQFYGSVQPFQHNYCGLGATGIALTGTEPLNGVDSSKAMYIPGLHGLTFATAAYGVEAHIQHLYAYTTEQDLPADCALIDPRFKYVNRGVAERWVDLNGKWAIPGNGYGESIIEDYWQPMLSY